MNGWTNYETWNAALWIQNDVELYRIAEQYRLCRTAYRYFVDEMKELGITETPDGLEWADPRINVTELNEMIQEF